MIEPKRHHLRRHRDDDYVDRITIQATTGASLVAYMVPRYKTSGLSGDEWRVNAVLEVRRHPHNNPIFERSFHRMGGWRVGLVHYGPIFVFRSAPELISSPNATLTVFRKGHVLMEQTFATFGEAAMGMAWHICVANEGTADVEWHHLSDEVEANHCQQVGCDSIPANVFRFNKLNYGDNRRTFLDPEYDWEDRYVWYCERHTLRGDCSMEDSDANLELIEGPGVGKPRGSDISPSIVMGLDDEGDD